MKYHAKHVRLDLTKIELILENGCGFQLEKQTLMGDINGIKEIKSSVVPLLGNQSLKKTTNSSLMDWITLWFSNGMGPATHQQVKNPICAANHYHQI